MASTEDDNNEDPLVKILTDSQREKRAAARRRIKDSYTYDKKLTPIHIEFLKDLEQHEEHRLSGIEGKLSSIIGQSGIIFTLIALFIPLFLDDLNHVALPLKIIYSVLFVLGLCFFTKSILSASATLKINDFPYARPDINSAFDKDNDSKAVFYRELVKDLITTIDINTASNTKKGHNLMVGHRFFVFGLTTMGLLGLIIAIQSFFYDKESDSNQAMLQKVIGIQMQLAESRRVLDQMAADQKFFTDSLKIEVMEEQLNRIDSSLKQSIHYFDKRSKR